MSKKSILPPCMECGSAPVRTGRFFCSPQCAEKHHERGLESSHYYYCAKHKEWHHGDDACEGLYEDDWQDYDPTYYVKAD